MVAAASHFFSSIPTAAHCRSWATAAQGARVVRAAEEAAVALEEAEIRLDRTASMVMRVGMEGPGRTVRPEQSLFLWILPRNPS